MASNRNLCIERK
uniref:Uncharacterized protein n=1 Tax=Arundo donax TaxID=35708 RepID=A0A0A9HB71_ARUDO